MYTDALLLRCDLVEDVQALLILCLIDSVIVSRPPVT